MNNYRELGRPHRKEWELGISLMDDFARQLYNRGLLPREFHLKENTHEIEPQKRVEPDWKKDQSSTTMVLPAQTREVLSELVFKVRVHREFRTASNQRILAALMFRSVMDQELAEKAMQEYEEKPGKRVSTTVQIPTELLICTDVLLNRLGAAGGIKTSRQKFLAALIHYSDKNPELALEAYSTYQDLKPGEAEETFAAMQ